MTTTVEAAVRRTMADLVTDRFDHVDMEATCDHIMGYELPDGTSREEVKAAIVKELDALRAEKARREALIQEAQGQG